MKVFVRVVEHGAFVDAADDLGISKASITTAVSQLEKSLGVRLLHRTTRRLSLTEEGRSYYEDCVRILGQIDAAEDNLSSSSHALRGRLRVSVSQSFEAMTLLPLLAEFISSHPELNVELIVTDMAVNLVEEGIDCALRATDIAPDAPLIARKVLTARWLTCASPEYLAQRGRPERIADLEGHNCIRFVSPSLGRCRDWQFDENGRVRNVEPRGSLSVTSLDAAASAALAGIGIAQVPDAIAYRPVLEGRLQPLLTEHITMALPVMFVYPANRYLPKRVRALGEFMSRAYPKEGWWPQIAAKIEADKGREIQVIDVAG